MDLLTGSHWRSRAAAVLLLAITPEAAGCLMSPSPTSIAPAAPKFAPRGETKCSVTSGGLEPLVVEWPSAARGELESRLRKGVVAVRFNGCELEVLPRCTSSVSYSYAATTRKRDHVVIRDLNDLYATLPRGAARLEAELQRSGELDVSMTIVGRFEAAQANMGRDDLSGECADATHVITAASIGAFDFYSMAGAKVAGSAGVGKIDVGGSSSADRTNLTQDGDENACNGAGPGDKNPPDACSAVLKIQLEEIGGSKKLAPVCPDGSSWDGKACVRQQVVTDVQCPAGSKWDGKTCVGEEGPEGHASPDAIRVAFQAPSGTDRWSLVDSNGSTLCAFPCTHWVSPTAGYALRHNDEQQVRPITSIGGLTPGQNATGAVETSGPAWAALTAGIAGGVGGGALITGATISLGASSSTSPAAKTLGTDMLIVGASGAAISLTGLILYLAITEYDVSFTSQTSQAARSVRWGLAPEGFRLAF